MNASFTKIAIAATAALSLAACSATRTHRSTGETIDDSALTGKVKAALIADPDTKARQIDVQTYRGVVQLNGFVDSEQNKDAATRVASSVAGVKNVENHLSVRTASRSAGEVLDDTVITTKVKTALIEDPNTKARDINVKTHDGVVQLSGFVDDAKQKYAAADVARRIAGVKDVQNDLQVKPAR